MTKKSANNPTETRSEAERRALFHERIGQAMVENLNAAVRAADQAKGKAIAPPPPGDVE